MTKPKTTRTLLEKRNAAMLNDFVTLFNKGFRTEAIYKKLGSKYFLAEQTAQKIVTAQANKKEVVKPPP